MIDAVSLPQTAWQPTMETLLPAGPEMVHGEGFEPPTNSV